MTRTPTKSPGHPQASPRKSRQPAPALYKATIEALASNKSAAIDNIESSTLERIKKCLQKAQHHGTGQSEMDAAMLLAKRLMGQYNVSQAEILAHEGTDERQKHAGESIVAIRRVIESTKADGAKQGVKKQGWVIHLADAIRTFFDCKCYEQGRAFSVNVVFYGLASNTVAAAQAFEITYNLVSEWARKVKGQGNGKSAKYAYCMGVAGSLLQIAEAEKLAEANLARGPDEELPNARMEEEKLQREADMDGLATGLGEDADNDGEDADMEMADVGEGGSDLEDEVDNRSMIERLISLKKPMRQIKISTISPLTSATSSTKHQSKKEPEQKLLWKSSTQLRTFRASAAKIADDYLEEKEVKLSTAYARETKIKDEEAYQQGVADGKTIDVRGKKIEG